MMTSRERVIATLNFQGPDRLPTDCWPLPSTWFGRETAVNEILDRYPTDIAMLDGENLFTIDSYTRGTSVDSWGCEWLNLQDGMIGEVKRAPLQDYDALSRYAWPRPFFGPRWSGMEETLKASADRFTLGIAGSPFERMQFLRSTERLYEDLADEECSQVYELRDRVFALSRWYVEQWSRTAVDGIVFFDDWGSQRSLLISPRKWREFYKPKYRELFDIALHAGKRIFFHSDGYIVDLYPDFIELGVSALNSQVWCMGLDALERFAGQVTFWGELDRQHLLSQGSPSEIRQAAQQMVQAFYRNGGLIGQCATDHLTPLANLQAALSAWGE